MDKSFILEKIINALLPPFCIGCEKETSDEPPALRWLCSTCRDKTDLHPSDICPLCRRESADNKFCLACLKESRLNKLIVILKHTETIDNLIKTHKYSFIKEISDTLFYFAKKRLGLIINAATLSDTRKMVVAPVPLHPWRLRWRGFNQSALLAKKIADKFGLPYVEDLLERRIYTLPQAKISDPFQRRENIKSSFAISAPLKKDIKDKLVILVDDVTTTGSTFNECASVLKKSGAKEIWGIAMMKG